MRPHLFLSLWFVACQVATTAAETPPTFNRDVRPILSENCFHCHGPDDDNRAADLRLDIAGEADVDEVIDRITSSDPDMVMPPPESERSLTQTQIETLQHWIAAGAEYEGHWSFVTPRPVPDATIDSLVDRQLESRSLTAAPPANKQTLIRRVTFDLTGLPPSVEEIDAFLADDSPHAYANLVDGLLSRASFGERMAADWLDAARYSDTYGFQVDRDRTVWPWRDWVVRAFNDNKPYDDFITDQIAGDLLPDATPDQILATTFNRLHPQECEGGSVPEEYRIESVTDRAQTVATAMMGLTYECCRCHNHKYDPISQSEYFQLTAFFDNINEAGLYSFFTDSVPTPTLQLPTDQQSKQLRDALASIADLEHRAGQLASSHASFWQSQIDDGFNDVDVAQPIYTHNFQHSPPGENQIVDGVRDGAFRLTGDDAVQTPVGSFRRSDPFSVSLWMKTPDAKDRAVVLHRSRAWTDAASRGYELLIVDGKLQWSLIHFWPGNAISIQTRDVIPVDRWVHVTVTNNGSSRAGGLAIYVDGKRANVDVVVDDLTKNITGGGGDTIAIGQRFRDRGFKAGEVDELQIFDVALTDYEAALLVDASEPALLRDHLITRQDAEAIELASRLHQARIAKCKIEDSIDEIMVMREMDTPRPTHVLGRGLYDQPGETVTPGTPAALPPMPVDAPQNRLGLAGWLCSPQHPLTARVAINRFWQMLFGTGLVRTPEDFGSQGLPPTHPDLLDHLAVEFIASGWDVKAMLKRIVMSKTYRRSSDHPDASVVERDPANQYLARFPSYRLPAEMLRDNAVFVSGRMVTTIGGPPVKPYEVEASYKPVDRDRGDGLYRRSIYTYWKRTAPAPVMMTLDASNREVCRVNRERTASPLQAFVMLNGPQYVEASRGLAEKLLRKHDIRTDSIAAIVEAFRTMTSRRPSDDETKLLIELYRQQRDYFSADQSRADKFLTIGDAPPDDSLDPTSLAAMTVVVGTLMNYDGSMVKR